MRKINMNLLLIVLSVAGFIISASRIATLILYSENSQFSSMPFSFTTLVRIAFWILLEAVIICAFIVYRRRRTKQEDEEHAPKELEGKKHKALFLVGSIAVVLIFAIVALSVSENSLLYHPLSNEEAEFYLDNNDSFEKVTIDCDDLRLKGWLRRASEDTKKTVVYFGGNAETSATTLVDYDIDGIWDCCFADYNIFMIDYPGYGLSNGSPSKATLFHMCDATIQHVIADDSLNQNVVVMGFSLGTGIATYAAANYDLDGLILIAPYDKMINVYNSMINIFHGPLKLIVKNNYESDVLAEKVDEKVLIIASEDDEVIPFKLSINLYKRFEKDCDILTVKEVGHNEIIQMRDARDRIREFLFTGI